MFALKKLCSTTLTLNELTLKKLFGSLLLLSYISQTSHAAFYDGKPYTDYEKTTAQAWLDGTMIFNAASLKTKYDISEKQINCVLTTDPNIVNFLDEHLRKLMSNRSMNKLNDFYGSDIGHLYQFRQYRNALKTLQIIPQNKDTRLPVAEGKAVLKVLKSKPMTIIRKLNNDYYVRGLLKAHAINKKYECNIEFENN